MTVEETMRKRLFESGVWDSQIEEIMERVKAAPENKPMAHRWVDEAAGYPISLLSLVWLTVKRQALAYIDEACPEAWFRPLFVSEIQVTSDTRDNDDTEIETS